MQLRACFRRIVPQFPKAVWVGEVQIRRKYALRAENEITR